MSFLFDRNVFRGNGLIEPYEIILCSDGREIDSLMHGMRCYQERNLINGTYLLDTETVIHNPIIVVDTLTYSLIHNLMKPGLYTGIRTVIYQGDFNTCIDLYEKSMRDVAFKAFLHLGSTLLAEYMPGERPYYKVYHGSLFPGNDPEHGMCDRGAVLHMINHN